MIGDEGGPREHDERGRGGEPGFTLHWADVVRRRSRTRMREEICAAWFAAEEPAEFMAPVEMDALELPGADAPAPDVLSGPEFCSSLL